MNIGDIVQLKSGGRAMTVIRVKVDRIDTKWMADKGEMKSASFPESALRSFGPKDNEDDKEETSG